ncbi:MAG TPA: hypothetical protein VGF94_07260 [Kofleriaceae bacterium]|jgi:hypothetical protein
MIAAVLLIASGSAFAGGQADTIGLGAEADIAGVAGVSVAYDAGKFDVDGLLGYRRVDPGGGAPVDSTYDFGARFFYHVHATALSDFGIGGGLGLASVPNMAGGGRQTDLYLEPAFQIRLFIASNVALSFSAGVSIAVADANTSVITGQGTVLDGGAAIHYFFF